jgi:hypothetical protein
MLICFVGLKEPGNGFRNKIAAKFNCPVFSFAEASKSFYDALAPVFGIGREVSPRMGDELQLLVRENVTQVHPKFYSDWMTQKLVDSIFKRGEENSSKRLQGIVLDLYTPWEYKVLRSFMINNTKVSYGAPKKTNKMILLENEALYSLPINKNYNDYLEFDVDATISSEDADCDIDETLKFHLAKWHLEKNKCQTSLSP